MSVASIIDCIESTDWTDVTCAYRSAFRVRDTLKSLLSRDESESAGACSDLYDFLYHQGVSLYDATARSIQILAQIAAEPDCITRARVAFFLGDVAMGCRRSEDQGTIDDMLKENNIRRDIAEQLWNTRPEIAGLITDDDENLRCVAPFTIAQIVLTCREWGIEYDRCPVVSRNQCELFKEQLLREKSTRVRTSLLCSLFCLEDWQSMNDEAEIRAKADSWSEMERLAITILRAQNHCAISDSEFSLLIDAINNPQHTLQVMGRSALADPGIEAIFPWFVPNTLVPIFDVLLSPQFITREETADTFCKIITKLNRLTADGVCRILDAYLPEGSLSDLKSLSTAMQNGLLKVLDAIERNDELWLETDGIRLVGDVQLRLHLEDSQKGREKLRAFILEHGG